MAIAYPDDIIAAISKPAEAKPWYQYRPIFLTKERIEGGVTFWNRHAQLLERAEREFGVPPEIIVAILGVETRYGKYTGKYRVIDALSTLAFEYPPRGRFFASELEQYLLMTREEQIEILRTQSAVWPTTSNVTDGNPANQSHFKPSSPETATKRWSKRGSSRRCRWASFPHSGSRFPRDSTRHKQPP